MQNWKLVRDSALVDFPELEFSDNEVVIADSGFASTSHPKLKFNFTMDVDFREPLDDVTSIEGNRSMRLMDIPVKRATRPNPTVNYVDLNFYNYRTKAATSVDYGTVTVTFYDDGDGRMHEMFQLYLQRISPVANNINMNLLDNPSSVPFGEMSSLGSVGNNPNGPIRAINIYHYYKSGANLLATSYKYINPKIQTFELDELDMSESDVNTITMTFTYDGVVIDNLAGNVLTGNTGKVG